MCAFSHAGAIDGSYFDVTEMIRAMRSAEFFLIGILCLCWVGCSKQPGLGSDPLKVGMELSYPPFEMTDEGNEPAGVSVDLAKELGDYLGREVEIENTPFDGLIPALRQGRSIVSSRA